MNGARGVIVDWKELDEEESEEFPDMKVFPVGMVVESDKHSLFFSLSQWYKTSDTTRRVERHNWR